VHLSGLPQFTPTGSIEPTMQILTLVMVSGLSMDYEVFLLSRVRERYDTTAAGRQPPAHRRPDHQPGADHHGGRGLRAGVRFIKLTGIGALIVGAFIVRVLLVPATTAQNSVPGLAGGPGNVIERQGRPGGAGIALIWLARSGYRLARPMVVSRWPQHALRAFSAVTASPRRRLPGQPESPDRS